MHREVIKTILTKQADESLRMAKSALEQALTYLDNVATFDAEDLELSIAEAMLYVGEARGFRNAIVDLGEG